MIWYQYIFLALSVAAYSISQLQQHGHLRWRTNSWSFWGEDSWQNKYKRHDHTFIMVTNQNWYYRLFDIPYIEKFPLSATALVYLTDGYHFMQFCFKILLAIGIFGFTWSALIAWSLWTGIQWGVFKIASK